MGFFFNAEKAAPKAKPKLRPRDIPIHSLNKMGCEVCPRDQDQDLRTPKMEPEGAPHPLVYLMATGPSFDEDQKGYLWAGKMGKHIVKKFPGAFFDRHVRSGHVTQCAMPGDKPPTVLEMECCRGRVEADIRASKPLLVIGIGDDCLSWATGLNSALRFRGQLIATSIGGHACWYLPIIYPNYLHKKNQFGKSEFELAIEHDIDHAVRLVDRGELAQPIVHRAPYDTGIELITGQEPGDMQRLEKAFARLLRKERIGVDIETPGLRPYIKDPTIWTGAVGTHEDTVAFAIDHPDGWGSQAQRARVHRMFADFLMNSGRKICHNLAFEMEWFGFFYGPTLLRATEWEDTMAMAHTLDERGGTKSLDVQTRIHFGFNLKAQSRVDPVRLLEYPIKEALRYNGLDTKWTVPLADVLMPMIEEIPAYKVEYERKVRAAPTLVLTELMGLPVDFDFAEAQSKRLAKEVKVLEQKIARCPEVIKYGRSKGAFDPGNSHHVLALMRDICQRDEVERKDRDGKVSYSTDEEVLSQLPEKEVPSAKLILEHRGVSKLDSTYVQPVLSREIISFDEFIHSKYSSMTAETGRLAADNPNIQNWPKRKYREIRGIVRAFRDGWILACDYGQIEFRVVGMASEDPNLVKYCWTGYDVHRYWAERMVEEYGAIKDYIVEAFGVDWDEKGIKTLRQEAKNGWVFPQLFGSSTRSCAEQLHLPEHVAERLGEEFWDEFRMVKKWQEKLLKRYEKNLYVETLGGRRRRGPMTKNQIINHPIQGTAADIVVEGMTAVSELAMLRDDPLLQPRLNVHDDLSFWLPDEGLESRIEIITTEMCRPRFDFINVPLIVEASVGQRWNDLHEIGVYRSDKLFNLRNPYLEAA